MTRENFDQFVKLNSEFIKNCQRVCKALERYDEYNRTNDYIYLDTFEYNKEAKTIWAFGIEYLWEGEDKKHYKAINPELLMLSDEELEKYIDYIIEKDKNNKLRIKEYEDIKQKERDLQIYNQIKEKYNL